MRIDELAMSSGLETGSRRVTLGEVKEVLPKVSFFQVKMRLFGKTLNSGMEQK